MFQVVKAFNAHDSETLYKLIDPGTGLIVLFKRGVFNEYEITSQIDFGQPIPEYLPFDDFEVNFNLSYDRSPLFDCDISEWNKVGLYCDTISVNQLLSKTAKNLKAYRGDEIPDSVITSFEELEEKSRRIVLIDSQGGELIFYLTRTGGSWYLTIIDRVSSDCSA